MAIKVEKYLNEEHKKIIKLRNSGFTQLQIAEELNISQAMVSKKYKKYNIPRNNEELKNVKQKERKKFLNECNRKIRNDLKSTPHRSYMSLVESLDFSYYTVYKCLSEKLNGNNIRKLKNIEECKRLNSRSCDVKYIPPTFGKKAVVDAETFEKIDTNGWCYCQKSGNVYRHNGKTTTTMNRFVKAIVENIDGKMVFYKNGKKLDNKQMNLQAATFREFLINNGAKGYKKDGSKFEARIRIKGKQIYLGRYDDEEDVKLILDFVRSKIGVRRELLNFPEIEDYGEHQHLILKLRDVIENGVNGECLMHIFD